MEQQVNITVQDAYLDKFESVVKRCVSAGLKLELALPSLGVITGVIDSDHVADLEKISGVQAVETSQTYHLPPPESDVQ